MASAVQLHCEGSSWRWTNLIIRMHHFDTGMLSRYTNVTFTRSTARLTMLIQWVVWGCHWFGVYILCTDELLVITPLRESEDISRIYRIYQRSWGVFYPRVWGFYPIVWGFYPRLGLLSWQYSHVAEVYPPPATLAATLLWWNPGASPGPGGPGDGQRGAV